MQTPILQMENSVFPDVPINIFFVGISETTPPCPPHWQSTVEILFFREDTHPTRCFCQNNSFEAQAGDLVIIPPNQVHAVQLTGPWSSHDCFLIQREFLEEFGLPTADVHFHLPIHDEEISRSFLRIRDLFNSYQEKKRAGSSATLRKLAIKAETLALYARLVDEHRMSEQEFVTNTLQDKYELIPRVMAYIKDNLTEPITLADISRHVQFSQSHLCHQIRELTGYTAMDLVNILRCQNARVILHEETCSISECARRSGFSSTSYMAKIYRRYYGESPSDTRRATQCGTEK